MHYVPHHDPAEISQVINQLDHSAALTAVRRHRAADGIRGNSPLPDAETGWNFHLVRAVGQENPAVIRFGDPGGGAGRRGIPDHKPLAAGPDQGANEIRRQVVALLAGHRDQHRFAGKNAGNPGKLTGRLIQAAIEAPRTEQVEMRLAPVQKIQHLQDQGMAVH